MSQVTVRGRAAVCVPASVLSRTGGRGRAGVAGGVWRCDDGGERPARAILKYSLTLMTHVAIATLTMTITTLAVTVTDNLVAAKSAEWFIAIFAVVVDQTLVAAARYVACVSPPPHLFSPRPVPPCPVPLASPRHALPRPPRRFSSHTQTLSRLPCLATSPSAIERSSMAFATPVHSKTNSTRRRPSSCPLETQVQSGDAPHCLSLSVYSTVPTRNLGYSRFVKLASSCKTIKGP